jgi:glutathione-specific gamma-glutamylcyclotransferase
VTLIERRYWESLADHHDVAPDRVWGVAYRIKADRVAEVKEYLDIREINGYSIHYTPFQPADGADPIRTLVYIGTPDNDQFTGPQDIQQLAEHIYGSVGPSGLNRDYLWELETALDALSPESGDQHVSDLSDRVRAVARRLESNGGNNVTENDTGTVGAEGAGTMGSLSPVTAPGSHPHGFHKISSIDEQEETEKAS